LKIISPKRITITDLARELSLSVCTIHKALTGKPPITEATRQRVLEVARKLGYRPSAAARSMGRPVIRLAAIYPTAWPSHTQALFDGARERLAELSDYRVEATFRTVPNSKSGKPFLKVLRQVIRDSVHGILFALICERDRESILEVLAESGIPHCALGHSMESDAPGFFYVWQDCRLCGKLAAEVLAFALPQEVETAIFIGRRDIPDHGMKIEGFHGELVAHGMKPPWIAEALDDPQMAYPVARKLFEEHWDIRGIYVGTENAKGILRFLEESGRRGKVKVVVTGISEPVAEGFQKEIVHASIHQRQCFQGKLAVDFLFKLLETGEKPVKETLVAPRVLFRGNFSNPE